MSKLVGAAILAALIARGGHAASPASLFERLDRAPFVLLATIGECEVIADPRLSRCVLRDGSALRGKPPEPLPDVVEELIFRSDRPVLQKDQRLLLLLEPSPAHSRLVAALGPGPHLRLVGASAGVLPAATAPVIERYLEATKEPDATTRARARIDALLAAIVEPTLGDEAVAALSGTVDLGRHLDEARSAVFAAALSNPAIPLERRRALIEVAGARQLPSLRPALRALLRDPELGVFARAALAKLGEAPGADQVRADLELASPRARIAALQAVESLPAAERVPLLVETARGDSDLDVRVEAIAALGRTGPPAIPGLARVMDDADRRVCYEAARSLAAIGSKDALDVLAAQFDGKSYDAQLAAVFALRGNATPAAFEILARVRKTATDPRLQKAIDFAAGAAMEHEH